MSSFTCFCIILYCTYFFHICLVLTDLEKAGYTGASDWKTKYSDSREYGACMHASCVARICPSVRLSHLFLYISSLLNVTPPRFALRERFCAAAQNGNGLNISWTRALRFVWYNTSRNSTNCDRKNIYLFICLSVWNWCRGRLMQLQYSSSL